MPYPTNKKLQLEEMSRFVNNVYNVKSSCTTYFSFLVDCVVSQWSSCSNTCGVGSQTREIQIQAQYGGLKCPSQLTKSCNLKICQG